MTHRHRYLLLVALTFVAYVSLGLPDGVLGVAWPSIWRAFDVPQSHLGMILLGAMAGYLLSSFFSPQIVRWIGIGNLLTLSSFIMVVSLLTFAFTPWWAILLVGSGLAGLGAGAIDAGISGYSATRFTPRTIVWMHACYGIGAMLGPAIMTAVLAANLAWRWGYGVVGAMLLAMTVAFAMAGTSWEIAPAGNALDSPKPVGAVAALRRAGVWGNISLFLIYTGAEATAGQWAYSLFTESRGMNETLAGLSVTAYWGSLTAGRILCGFIANRFSVKLLLRISMVIAPIVSLLIWQRNSAAGNVAGLALLGFFFGPIYPLMLAETPKRLGEAVTEQAIGFQVAAAYLGISLVPGFAGMLTRAYGLEIIAPMVFALGLILLILHEIALRLPRHESLQMETVAST
jgi:fucose permease